MIHAPVWCICTYPAYVLLQTFNLILPILESGSVFDIQRDIRTSNWKFIKNKTYCISSGNYMRNNVLKVCIFHVYKALFTEYMLHNRFM